MKILFLSLVIVSLLVNKALCQVKVEHQKSTVALKDVIKVSPSKEQLSVSLPDIAKNLTDGEVITCSQKGADGKYTLFYSSVGGLTSELLSGERESNTRKMFNSVSAMKAGDWMGVDFKYQRNGKDIPMKSHVFPVTESIICVLVWPTSGLSDDISYGLDMAKVAPPTPPVAATPLISPTAPMQQGQTEAVLPVDGAATPSEAANQAPPIIDPAAAAVVPEQVASVGDPAAASTEPAPTAESAQVQAEVPAS